jgi:hypothetical protein
MGGRLMVTLTTDHPEPGPPDGDGHGVQSVGMEYPDPATGTGHRPDRRHTVTTAKYRACRGTRCPDTSARATVTRSA